MTRIAVAVVEHRDSFLVGTRAEGGTLAGYAEFPGGKVEPGEEPADAAARECWEEAGIACVVEAPYPEVVHHYAHGKLRIYFFACRPSDPNAALRAPFRWTPRAELAALKFPEANAALLKFLTTRRQ